MQKVLVLLFLLLINGCTHKETPYESFRKRFNQKYPDGISLNQGWYEIRKSFYGFGEDSDGTMVIYDSSYKKLNGFFAFSNDSKIDETLIKKFHFETFSISPGFNKKGLRKLSESFYDGINYWEKVDYENVIESSVTRTQETRGTDKMKRVAFRGPIYDWFNHLSPVEHEDTYDGLSYLFSANENKLQVTNSSLFDDIISNKISTYIFDDELNLTECVFSLFEKSLVNSDDNVSEIISLKKSNEEDFEVPKGYLEEIKNEGMDISFY